MTSTPVMSSQGASIMFPMNTTQNVTKSANPDFKTCMENSTKSDEEPAKVTKEESLNKRQEMQPEERRMKENNTKQTEVTGETDAENRELTDEEDDAIVEAVMSIFETIKFELNVTGEDIKEVLDEMGVNPMALLDEDVLKAAVLKLSGAQDAMSLVTDANLYEAVGNITDICNEQVEDLCKKLLISPEEFSDAVAKAIYQTNDMPETELVAEVENVIEVETSDIQKVSQDISIEVPNYAEEDKAEPKVEVKITKTEKVSAQGKATPKIATDSKAGQDTEPILDVTKDFGKDGEFNQSSQTPFTFTQNLVDRTIQALTKPESTVPMSYDEAQNVINQITESIKIEITNETSEVNLRLHPESLGNVNVKVSANNEGVMTATFTAQNESVKAVIESQAIVLKESLESKGITIEAVEVTVSSHRFDEDLNERGRDHDNRPAEKRTRRINLSEISEDDENDDELRIAKEMMERNGNTIDYIA